MNNFQITIIPSNLSPPEVQDNKADKFQVRQHKGGVESAVESIESLEKVWDTVIEKLSNLASKASVNSSQYELSEIEFNIGIEAGLSVGLVTKGNASVMVKFTKTP